MTDDTGATDATSRATTAIVAPGAVPASREAWSRDGEGDDRGTRGVFATLVRGDEDITGLVAYSIYKQHKLDWLRAFEASRGREPNEAELTSYLCGEGTPRRLATYRHLADATLAGRGPRIDGPQGETRDAFRSGPAFIADAGRDPGVLASNGLSRGQVVAYLIIAAIFVVGVVLALRFTAPH